MSGQTYVHGWLLLCWPYFRDPMSPSCDLGIHPSLCCADAIHWPSYKPSTFIFFFLSCVSFVQAQWVESTHGRVHMVRKEEGRQEHSPCAAKMNWTRHAGEVREKRGREVHFLLCWIKGKQYSQKDRPALQKISTTESSPECCQTDLCYRKIKVQSVKMMLSVQNFPFLKIRFLEVSPSWASKEKGKLLKHRAPLITGKGQSGLWK